MKETRLFELERIVTDELSKVCSGCHVPLPLTCFAPDKRYKDGVYHACRSCLREQAKAVRRVDYDALLIREGGVCGVCRRAPQIGERFDIDHDHDLGDIRGLLCRRCNVAYGMLGESLDIISSLLAYHLRWRRVHGVDPDLRRMVVLVREGASA